jgi:hypothetical protein
MSFNRFAAGAIALGLMFVFSPMAAATQTPAQDTTAKPAVSSLINLNSANAAELEKLPVNTAWQARMAGLLDVAHDYSADGADASLPVVWEL